MATTLFLTEVASSISTVDLDLSALIETRGGGLTVSTTNTSTIAHSITDTAGGTAIIWFSPPLESVTISGTITFNVWMAESNMSANVDAEVIVQRANGTTGATISTIIDSAKGTEVPVTTRAAQNWTGSPTSTTISAGERIKIAVLLGDTLAQASGFTATTGYAGTSGSADGDTFVTFTETITEQAVAGNPPDQIALRVYPQALAH